MIQCILFRLLCDYIHEAVNDWRASYYSLDALKFVLAHRPPYNFLNMHPFSLNIRLLIPDINFLTVVFYKV